MKKKYDKMKDIKIKDEIICVKVCKMNGDNRTTTTLFKSYYIEHIYNKKFSIIDDENNIHNFINNGEYFIHKSKFRKLKLEKIQCSNNY